VTYDKIVNVDFVGVRRWETSSSRECNDFFFNIFFFSSIRQEVRSSGDGSPTLECLRECDRLRERCLSVVVMADRFSPDFSRNGTSGTPRIRCYILDRSASADSAALSFTPNSVYYEKTCLPGRLEIFRVQAWPEGAYLQLIIGRYRMRQGLVICPRSRLRTRRFWQSRCT
jgi:hypothetical protein